MGSIIAARGDVAPQWAAGEVARYLKTIKTIKSIKITTKAELDSRIMPLRAAEPGRKDFATVDEQEL
jgi:hypothetical protein